MDLARGHVAALDHLDTDAHPERRDTVRAFNLGSGHGKSVLEVVEAFRRASGREVPTRVGPRRAGDLPAYWADPSRAADELGWRTELGLDDACRDTWRWQTDNPGGYA